MRRIVYVLIGIGALLFLLLIFGIAWWAGWRWPKRQMTKTEELSIKVAEHNNSITALSKSIADLRQVTSDLRKTTVSLKAENVQQQRSIDNIPRVSPRQPQLGGKDRTSLDYLLRADKDLRYEIRRLKAKVSQLEKQKSQAATKKVVSKPAPKKKVTSRPNVQCPRQHRRCPACGGYH